MALGYQAAEYGLPLVTIPPDPRVLQRNDPFSVVHWCGGVLGVVGKKVRWDELLRFKCAIDRNFH